MTVAELIAVLQKFPPDGTVYYESVEYCPIELKTAKADDTWTAGAVILGD